MSLDLPSFSGRRVRVATAAAAFALCFAGAPLVQAQQPPNAASETGNRSAAAGRESVALPSFAPMVKRVLPAVVNISVQMKPGAGGDQESDQEQFSPDQNQPFPGFPPSPFDQFLRRFFDQQGNGGMPMPQQRVQRIALGSGFIIDPTGYVVTNNHVVENAGKVTVIFQDGTKHPAKVVGRDPKTDLALLKIEAPKPLPYVQWGDSNAVQVGDWVMAVGNPFGLGGTVSAGVISARGRDIHEGPYDDFLQIDASINRGNSGGPTFNLNGQVIGINTAIYSPNGGSVGIGFAIPSSLAKPVIEQLREHGKVERGWLGVEIQQVTPELAQSLGLPKPEGALVADVTAGGPASKVGIKQGDVILDYDGHHIATLRDLPIAVAETPVGQTARVTVWRDHHETKLEPVIAAMPSNMQQMAQNGEGEGSDSAMGLTLAPLTQQQREQLHVGKNVKGVVVTGVAPDSPLADLGLQPGDVIQEINQQPVTTPQEAVQKLQALNKQQGQENIMLLLNRHGVNQYVAVTVQPNGQGGNG